MFPVKPLFLIILLFITASACQTDKPVYTIQGTLPSSEYDGEWIYLAPLVNATTETIDSVKIENSQFTFEGMNEEMRVIRMRMMLRHKFQELLVVTEPGLTTVIIDSVSSASGTPQNEALQLWKEEKAGYDSYSYQHFQKLKTATPADSAFLSAGLEAIKNDFQLFNFNFMNENWNNTAGRFLYPLIKPTLSVEQQEALHELD